MKVILPITTELSTTSRIVEEYKMDEIVGLYVPTVVEVKRI